MRWIFIVALLAPAALLPLRTLTCTVTLLPLVYFVLFAPLVALFEGEGAKARAAAFVVTLACQLALAERLASLAKTPGAVPAVLAVGLLEPLISAAVVHRVARPDPRD